MVWLEAFWVALSTYSAIPVPRFEWTQRSTRYAICFFPAVGLVCGAALLGWCWLCGKLEISAVLAAAFAVCLPLLITGGIHMDGYLDTVDALASHQPKEKKLEILKDSNCGAFAIIFCGVYLLISVGLYHELFAAGRAFAMCPVFVFSRALSALCAVTMPNARKSGMLCAFTENAGRLGTVIAMSAVAALAGGAMLLLAPVQGGVGVALGLLWTAAYRSMANRQFGGATGDTAGFFLQICELAVLLGAWIGGMIA